MHTAFLLNLLWVTCFASNEQDHTCSICFTSTEFDEDGWQVRGCEHWFHRSCLERWIERERSCPNCRRTILITLESSEHNKIENMRRWIPVLEILVRDTCFVNFGTSLEIFRFGRSNFSYTLHFGLSLLFSYFDMPQLHSSKLRFLFFSFWILEISH